MVCVERINAVWHLEQQLRPFILSSSTYKQALSCERRHVASDQYSTSFYGRMIFSLSQYQELMSTVKQHNRACIACA